mmetsp:Transcript_18561/g.32224  ORF Transcript_18561/g.32224 Transcript_18561/m.32224 type:complete len:211 (-) Transcript_18561:122-754(-)
MTGLGLLYAMMHLGASFACNVLILSVNVVELFENILSDIFSCIASRLGRRRNRSLDIFTNMVGLVGSLLRRLFRLALVVCATHLGKVILHSLFSIVESVTQRLQGSLIVRAIRGRSITVQFLLQLVLSFLGLVFAIMANLIHLLVRRFSSFIHALRDLLFNRFCILANGLDRLATHGVDILSGIFSSIRGLGPVIFGLILLILVERIDVL